MSMRRIFTGCVFGYVSNASECAHAAAYHKLLNQYSISKCTITVSGVDTASAEIVHDLCLSHWLGRKYKTYVKRARCLGALRLCRSAYLGTVREASGAHVVGLIGEHFARVRIGWALLRLCLGILAAKDLYETVAVHVLLGHIMAVPRCNS